MILRVAAAIAAVLLLEGCCCCCGGGTPLTDSEREQLRIEREAREAEEAAEKQEARERAPKLAAGHAKIAALIDPSAKVPKSRCPDATIRGNLGDTLFSGDLWTLRWEALPGATPATDDADWAWLDDGDAKRLAELATTPETVNEYALEALGRKEHRYLGVIVSQGRNLPGTPRIGGIGGFDPARWSGGIYVVDLLDAQVICSAPFSATNSDASAIDLSDPFPGDRREAAIDDFEQNLEYAANDALYEVTQELTVNVVGIF